MHFTPLFYYNLIYIRLHISVYLGLYAKYLLMQTCKTLHTYMCRINHIQYLRLTTFLQHIVHYVDLKLYKNGK